MTQTAFLSLRDAGDADMDHVAAIYAFHVRKGLASFEEAPPSSSEMRARRQSIVEAGLPYIVAEDSGRLVGYAYAAPYRARSAYRFTLEDSVYVVPDRPGRGIGTALLDELLRRCERGQWRQMVAVIGDSGNEGSIALHRRCGFRMVGTLASVGFKKGRWVDSVLMQRALGMGDATPAVSPNA